MKRNLKKLISFILVVVSLVIATGCQNKTIETNQESKSDQTASVATTTSPSEEQTDDVAELTADEVEATYLKEPAASRVIHIGYDGGLCQGAIAIAHEKGFFAEEGLNTELTKSESPRDAIAGGKIDTSAGMIAGWLKPITNGVNLVFTLGLHTGCTSAIVLADSEINSFADAKGSVIGISGGIGGVNHNIGYRMIAHDNLLPEDFIWSDFPADQLLLLLQNGDIQVAIAGDQMAEKWVQQGLVKRVRSTTLDEDFKDETCCVLGLSGTFLEENPIASEKISRAIYKASLWVQDNKKEAAQILIDKGHVSGEVDYIASLLDLYDFRRTNEQTEKSILDSTQEYKNLGVLNNDLNVDTLQNQIWHPYDLESFTN
jgi:NitT/TauT family transport system substrate-binding protein